jgi:hypothetical protein
MENNIWARIDKIKNGKSVDNLETSNVVTFDDDEMEPLLDVMELLIKHDLDYYENEAIDDMNEEEYEDYFNDEILGLKNIYEKVKKDHRLEYDDFRKLVLDIDFGIFEIIRDDRDIDNPVWLYNVMQIWHKMAVKTEFYDKCNLK